MDALFTQSFDTRDQLIEALQRYAITHGFVITIGRSVATRNIRLQCDRSGQYIDRIEAANGAKRRRTCSRLIGCPFFVYASRSDKTTSDGKWHIKSFDLTHTHETNQADLITHPGARNKQLSDDQKAKIEAYLDQEIPYRQLIDLIRADYPDLLITPKDLENLRKAWISEKLANQTPVEYLISQLNDGNWQFALQHDLEGRITFLIFAHNESIRLANQYNRVFVLDCIYKTNRYNMPLLHIIGCSPSNSNFSIAFCLMLNEQEGSYQWALETFFNWLDPIDPAPVLCSDRDLALIAAIEAKYADWPHILCLWHINKAVLAKCKPFFVRSDLSDEEQTNQNKE